MAAQPVEPGSWGSSTSGSAGACSSDLNLSSRRSSKDERRSTRSAYCHCDHRLGLIRIRSRLDASCSSSPASSKSLVRCSALHRGADRAPDTICSLATALGRWMKICFTPGQVLRGSQLVAQRYEVICHAGESSPRSLTFCCAMREPALWHACKCAESDLCPRSVRRSRRCE